MKNLILILLIFSPLSVIAQTVNKPKERVKAIGTDHTNSAMDREINKGFNKLEDGIGGLFKKKKKKDDSQETEEKKDQKQDAQPADNESNTSGKAEGNLGSAKAVSFKSYSKFDFVSGEKVIALDDFSTTETGDFPANWNTNSSGEIVKMEGQEGRWLKMEKEGVLFPEYITSLPDNFTLEFDLACNPDFSFYSSPLSLVMASIPNASKDFVMWKSYGQGDKNGIQVSFHPQDAGGSAGSSEFHIFKSGESIMNNTISSHQFFVKNGSMAKISVWRQKSRLRVYMNEEKIWDLPKAFDVASKYNTVLFSRGGGHVPTDQYLIRNLRLAVGAPDTRSKLITEGRFVTTGILFDVNSDKIKPESFGVLKSVSQVLTENPTVKIKIIGHTDTDGEDAANLSLSKKRAESVRSSLSSEFGIAADRIQTDGKGEGQPVDNNSTPVGKANNRRVEFVKL